tara:strand:+ start:2014 stop:3039 length:1026 start_codon:yes stop_codon:yes gene_type:complete
MEKAYKTEAQVKGIIDYIQTMAVETGHFVTTRWDKLPTVFEDAKYQVHQDILTALRLRSIGIKKENIVAWHDNNEQRELLKQLCGQVNTEAQDLKNFHDVGNVAFTISDDMFWKLNYDNPVKMIGPAGYSVAPEFKHGPTKAEREIKQLLEKNGLKRVVHIPHNFFKQQDKKIPEKMVDAKVQCCLYETEPGYTGDVEVHNIATGKTFFVKRGQVYPKSDKVFGFYDGKKSAWTKVLDQNPTEITLQDDVIGFPMFNKSTEYDDEVIDTKYQIPLMTKKAEWYKPGDTIPIGTVCFKVDPNTAQQLLDIIRSDDYAKAYQAVCTSSRFSATALYKLNVSPE